MCRNRMKQILRRLTALLCVCALLCVFVPAADVAVEDVPAIAATETAVEVRSEVTAPQTAAIIETVAQAETAEPAVQQGTFDLSGVLQAGGFPRADETAVRAELQSGDDPYEAVKNEIVNGLRNRTAEINIKKYGVSPSMIPSVYQSVLNNHAELFYVLPVGCGYTYSGTVVYTISPHYSDSLTEADTVLFNPL